MDRRARIIVVACLDSGCAPVAIGARLLQMSAFIDSLIVSQCIISFWHPRLKGWKVAYVQHMYSICTAYVQQYECESCYSKCQRRSSVYVTAKLCRDCGRLCASPR